MLEYLKEENNYMPRYGAIGISGLAGVVLGLRGGIVRRVTYGTAAALAMASLCYPAEAREITRESLYTAKKYVRVGYNFIYGEKVCKPSAASLASPILVASHSDEVSLGDVLKGYAEERQKEAKEKEARDKEAAAVTEAAAAAAPAPCPVRNPKHGQMQVRFACLKDPLVRELPPERAQES